MEQWEIEEAEVAAKLMLHGDYPALACHIFYIIRTIAVHGLITWNTAGLMCIFTITRLFFYALRNLKSAKTRFWLVFFLYEVGQVSNCWRVFNNNQESFAVNLIASTTMLMIGEISPVHSLLLNGLLVAKHILLWALIAQVKSIGGEFISVLPAVWVFWLLLFTQEHKRKVLRAKQQAEEAKRVEECRLKALLYAMPDGVVVISEAMQVLTHNPALLLQFDLKLLSSPVRYMEMFLGHLCYDPEYLAAEEVQPFKEDLKQLFLEKEGTSKSFKPVVFEGRHLECRGCVSRWDETKVLVLTIRDTSNWVHLEQAAKRDSATKSALIRSVSHELRTPINAIINLCQDLQTSTAVGEREKADIEVIANASNFLLSMINDLLDYSKILHDKFALMKTNFDLKNLIRNCGALIALQCKQKNVELRVRYDPLLPKFAYTDENRLQQVILNLLSNAAK